MAEISESSANRATFTLAFHRKWNVMFAVMMRDMRTRFFNHGLGFLVVALWPLAHLGALLLVYGLLGRTAPYGDMYIFFSTGLIPTLTFMYTSRFMAMSLVHNKPMMSFPVVHATDIAFGRAILECAASYVMASLTFLLLVMLDTNPVPSDIPNAVAALLSTQLLAVSVGLVAAVISQHAPMTVTLYSLFMIVIYLSSGTLFVPASLPPDVIEILAWNPVLHATEWMRRAYFLGYPDQVLDKTYMLSFAGVSLFFGLFLERILRRS